MQKLLSSFAGTTNLLYGFQIKIKIGREEITNNKEAQQEGFF